MYQSATIFNVSLDTADQQYDQLLPNETRKVLIRSRNGGDIKLAYADGMATYITIPAGSGGKWLEGVFLRGVTLFMKSALGSDVAEIEVWKDVGAS